MTLKALVLGSAMVLGGTAHAYTSNDGCPAGYGTLTLYDGASFTGNSETICVSNTSPVSLDLTNLTYQWGVIILPGGGSVPAYRAWSSHIVSAKIVSTSGTEYLKATFSGANSCDPWSMSGTTSTSGFGCVINATTLTMQNFGP